MTKHHLFCFSQVYQTIMKMLANNILLSLVSVVAVTNAYIVPDWIENGVYEHHVDERGNEVHVKIANNTDYFDSTIQPALARRSLGMRQLPRPSCGAQKDLNHAVSW